MDAIVWRDKYETGLPSVDCQHRKLVRITASLADALARTSEVTPDEVRTLFSELGNYGQVHFADEEALMLRAGVDARTQQEQRQQHQGFIQDVTRLGEIAVSDNRLDDAAARTIMNFLVSWIAFHMLHADQQMAEQIKLVEQGVAPSDAYTQVSHKEDESVRLTLDAINGLTSVVVQKNRDLAALNASLEQRVDERTRELQQRISQLRDALDHVRTLQGIIPICMHCHQIRSDGDSWERLEIYIQEHSEAEFSHGICPACLEKHYSNL
jgi:hemerythrin